MWKSVLSVGCVLAAGIAASGLASAAAPPNVLLIVSDDQAWTDYGFMGHPHIRTPALDRLASQSLVFPRGYVPTSLCRPSLATMLTGLYPHQHGIVGNDPDLPDGAPSMGSRANPQYAPFYEALMANIERHPTLPRLLVRQGYLAHQTGKWWEGSPARGGFTSGMTHGDPKRGGRHGDEGLKIGRQGLQSALDFLAAAQQQGRPFCLWYAPMLPHSPHNPPARFLEKYRDQAPTLDIARYWAMCEWFDETCGQLLDALEQQQLADNTIVVYLCDNGWINLPDKDAVAPRSKRTPYEGGIRTPIMVRWPKRVEPRRDEQTLATSLDLLPTVLTACGVPLPPGLPGLNLLDQSARAGRHQLFGEIYSHNVADIKQPAASLYHRWTIDGTWKLIVPYAPNVPRETAELYDLATDPQEHKNLAAERPELVQRLSASVEAWWPAAGR